MDLVTLYEDADIIAVDKPAGALTPSVGEQLHFEPTHRLDRETSGVLVLAKTPEALEYMRKAFTEREVKKTYYAWVHGVLKDKKGVISFPIGRSRKDFRLRSAQPKAKGKLRDAITRYEVVLNDGTHTLVKVMPETGRTHQIRVHFKAIHHPVVGDPLYATNRPDSLSLGRLGLHAYEIDIPLPSGGRKTITAPMPLEFERAGERFARA